MANIYKFQVTNKVQNTLGLGFANVAAGDTFYLVDTQLQNALVRNAIQQGYVEPVGEDDSVVTGIMMDYFDAKLKFSKNVFPSSAVTVVPPIASAGIINVVAADLSDGYLFGRKIAITGIEARFSTASSAAAAPRLLVTAGNQTPVTPTLLTAFDYNVGSYTAATNGSIANNAPITWAASDQLIIGYTSKFASVVFAKTTANSASTLAVPYYWDGSAWVVFPSYTDYTKEVTGKTFSRVGNVDKTRIVWWETPDDWVAGGPTGSLALPTDYCIALQFNGVLTALAAASLYPVLDRPIADVNLGYDTWAPDSVVQKLGVTYTDQTGIAVAWSTSGMTTTDYIWVGFDKKASGFYVNIDGDQLAARTMVLTYWNGKVWSSVTATATDGTADAGATLGQDGTISLVTVPVDWTPAAATDTTGGFPGASTPTTVTTDELYWLRYSVSGALDANGTCVILRGAPSVNTWTHFEPEQMTFVDANEELHMNVTDENSAIAATTINVMVGDL